MGAQSLVIRVIQMQSVVIGVMQIQSVVIRVIQIQRARVSGRRVPPLSYHPRAAGAGAAAAAGGRALGEAGGCGKQRGGERG